MTQYKIFYAIAALCLTTTHVYANCVESSPPWAKDFDQVYKHDEFLIYYTNTPSSPHYVLQRDLNHNQIPDYVEDVARQAIASRDVFSLAGFKHPLQSERYKNQAQAISIFIKNMKGNGIAYEVVSKYSNLKTKSVMPCSLSIHISNHLTDFPGNYWTTVSHEFFHLYQYGYSQFKQSWYLESLANWAERGLRVDVNSQTKKLAHLPQNVTDLEQQIFQQSYHQLWRRYFYLNPNDVLKIPNRLYLQKYVNGQTIFKDQFWYGTSFVKGFLNTLEQRSNTISDAKQWPRYQWQESAQKDPHFNCVILQAYQQQLQKQQHSVQESTFLTQLNLNSQTKLCS